MKLSIFFFAIYIISNSSAATFFQFRNIQCKSSGKSVNVSFCYVKTYARTRFTVNIEIVSKRVLNMAKANYLLTKENSMGSFDNVIKLESIEICKAFQSTQNHDFLKFLMDIIKRTSIGKIMEACDKIGVYRAINISIAESPLIQIMPIGNYKTTVDIFDDLDDKILNFVVVGRLFRKK